MTTREASTPNEGTEICSVCHKPRRFFAGDTDVCMPCAVFGPPDDVVEDPARVPSSEANG